MNQKIKKPYTNQFSDKSLESYLRMFEIDSQTFDYNKIRSFLISQIFEKDPSNIEEYDPYGIGSCYKSQYGLDLFHFY